MDAERASEVRLLLDLETTIERLASTPSGLGVFKRAFLAVELGVTAVVVKRVRQHVESGGPLLRDLATIGNDESPLWLSDPRTAQRENG